jgi:hypothetical protein
MGDLQLLAGNTLIWHSGTAGKGVTTLSLATVGDYGNLRLLDAKNRTVWQSFDYPEFAIIPTQKFRFRSFSLASITDVSARSISICKLLVFWSWAH